MKPADILIAILVAVIWGLAYAAIARFPINIAIQTLVSLLVGAVSTVVWVLFGTALRPVLTSERLVRAFNILMAILLLASLYPVVMDA